MRFYLWFLRWFFGLLLRGLWDGILVSLGYRWRPATGRPRRFSETRDPGDGL